MATAIASSVKVRAALASPINCLLLRLFPKIVQNIHLNTITLPFSCHYLRHLCALLRCLQTGVLQMLTPSPQMAQRTVYTLTWQMTRSPEHLPRQREKAHFNITSVRAELHQTRTQVEFVYCINKYINQSSTNLYN